MKLNWLKSVVVAAGAMFSAVSFAGVIADPVAVNAYLNEGQTATWTHDLNDNGFSLGSAIGGYIVVDFADDRWFDGLEFASIQIEIGDLLGDDSGLHMANFDYASGLSLTSLVSLNADGLLDVVVTSLMGDFFVVASTLTVFTTDTVTVATTTPVPEPATLALFGLGLIGLGISRRKAKSQ